VKKSAIILALGLFSGFSLCAQVVDEIIKQGNDLYKLKQYEAAKKSYDDALNKDTTNTTAKFNLANTEYRLAKPDDAVKSFDELASKYTKDEEKARVFYNKGVVLSNQKRLEESIEAYKEALRQNPNDKDARENLQKALMELKKKTPPPKKDNQKKKQENKKQKEQPKMDQKEAQQKLQLLEQKEKQLQQRMQQQKSKTGGSNTKDW